MDVFVFFWGEQWVGVGQVVLGCVFEYKAASRWGRGHLESVGHIGWALLGQCAVSLIQRVLTGFCGGWGGETKYWFII